MKKLRRDTKRTLELLDTIYFGTRHRKPPPPEFLSRLTPTPQSVSIFYPVTYSTHARPEGNSPGSVVSSTQVRRPAGVLYPPSHSRESFLVGWGFFEKEEGKRVGRGKEGETVGEKERETGVGGKRVDTSVLWELSRTSFCRALSTKGSISICSHLPGGLET